LGVCGSVNMRYLGSKSKLIDFIHAIFEKYNIQGHVLCDLFAGTSCVAESFKDEYDIVANDFMYYSYCFSTAKLTNSSIPTFSKFKKIYDCNIFDWLNQKEYASNEQSFIYNNYSPKGKRQFFTEDNAKKIDGIRQTIELLFTKEIISRNEYYFLLASLLDCVTKFSNTSGTYEAYFKFWDNRALKQFVLEPIEIKECKTEKQATIYRENSNKLIRRISGDILYLDPPYTVTQYASAYNLLETVSLYDSPQIKGVGGKRGKGDCVSYYCYKNYAKEEFEDIFRQAQFHHVIISYSNQGVVPLNELICLARKFAKDGIVHVDYYDYQEYQNHRSSNKRNGEKLKEVLIYFQKDLAIIKSPLNYAGSKDKLFPTLQKYFPKHIGTFVDVMGGAFNVGVNVCSTSSVVYNDYNPYVFSIINWLLTTTKEEQIKEVESIIELFAMEKGNEVSYNKLRYYYNFESKSIECLFVLHMYAFQNYLRFNKDQHFNTPIGVAGYSEDLRDRMQKFLTRCPSFRLLNHNFTDIAWNEFPIDTLFYFDPPYSITKAAYNDGKRGLEGWSEQSEEMLFTTLDKINSLGYKFILSNLKEHKGKENTRLIKWVEKEGYNLYEVGVSGWRYTKHEIIVTNYKGYGNISINK